MTCRDPSLPGANVRGAARLLSAENLKKIHLSKKNPPETEEVRERGETTHRTEVVWMFFAGAERGLNNLLKLIQT